MKKPIRLITLLVAAVASGFSAAAQPALNVATVDLVTIYESYWETQANEEKLRETFQRAEDEAQRLRADGTALVEDFRALEERSNNSMLTQQARDEAAAQLEEMANQIQVKQQELQQFVVNTQRQLEQRRNTHQTMMMDKITEVALEIGRAQGATLIVDTSGPTGLGLSTVLYSDPAYDITEQVKAELEKTKPEEEAEDEEAAEEEAAEEEADAGAPEESGEAE